jgi:hypothetical protein
LKIESKSSATTPRITIGITSLARATGVGNGNADRGLGNYESEEWVARFRESKISIIGKSIIKLFAKFATKVFRVQIFLV